jgi:hypothetical protein
MIPLWAAQRFEIRLHVRVRAVPKDDFDYTSIWYCNGRMQGTPPKRKRVNVSTVVK